MSDTKKTKKSTEADATKAKDETSKKAPAEANAASAPASTPEPASVPAPAPAEEEDPWAAALAEQAQAEDGDSPDPVSTSTNASQDVFRPLSADSGPIKARDLEMVMDIPVKLSVELGRTRITIKQLLELAQGSVVELDGLPGEPMDILINGYLIAQGEVVVIEEKFGIRITEIVTPSERLQRLNR